ncbi:MAG: hypothetical protein M1835_002278 [Candelina submexicana]|nr:MAG: hypothetical protein M1835_002278 [Candelina submexicana]
MPPLSSPLDLISTQTLYLRDIISAFADRAGSPHASSISPRAPTLTAVLPPTLAHLIPRQQVTSGYPVIPTGYSGLNAGPSPGTVVGIVLGSVAGFLIILWLLYAVFNRGGGADIEATTYTTRERRRSRSRSRSRSPRPPPPRPMSVRHSPPRPPPPQVVQERIIIDDRRAPPPPQPPPPVVQERIIIDEREPDEEIVEVIEENSPPRRGHSHRNRTSSGGYRTVDPDAYAGGNRPLRKVSGRR